VDTLLLVLRVGLSLAVVVVLLWMAQKRLSRGSGSAPESGLRLVNRRSVGQKASVVVLDADGRRFLLGVTEHSINVLHESEAPQPAQERDPVGPGTGSVAAGMDDGGALPLRARHHRPGVLSGSILSPRTWQQAGAALRKALSP
jgi:flagellar protein FliO/FliZ